MVRGNGVVASVRENSMETTPYDDIYLEPSDLRLRGFPREDIVTSSPGAYKREWLHPLTYYLCVVSPRLLARRVVVFFINRRRQQVATESQIRLAATGEGRPWTRPPPANAPVLFLPRMMDQAMVKNHRVYWKNRSHRLKLNNLAGEHHQSFWFSMVASLPVLQLLLFGTGTVFITVGAFLPSAPALCNTESCSSMNGTQHLVYFSGLYLTAIGCGGVRSALLPLGADQFNNDSSLDIQKRRNFFSLFYICVIFGVITSGTIVVWIQENVSWAIGYGVATACIALALIGFLVGTPIFRRHEPHGSPVRSVFQVIVASFRNLALELPADSSLLYEVRRKNTQKSEPKLAHTDDFRFLDKAAIMSDLSLDQDSCTSPWRICTVTQVEELKILIRLLPIWATGIFFCVGISQMHTTFIQQGTVMNTKIGSLSIPAASLYSFEVICVTFWVFLVNKVIIPVTRACFANGAEMTQLQRIGIGRFLMIFAMAIAAFLEMKRLESVQGGDQPLSIAWQLPQYFVIAGAECFTIITQLEFFHGQAPDSMKSMLTAFALLTTALGNYFSSAIITLIARVTGTWHSPGWIPDDLNKGHLDYYYWCLAAISAVNFVVYIYFASKYKLKKAVIQV
uniref:Uncharacterized protein n=1 Tax=Oryza glumipatula TaxID=40148 RepID=A0A0E0AME1_9ORYZ